MVGYLYFTRSQMRISIDKNQRDINDARDRAKYNDGTPLPYLGIMTFFTIYNL